MPIRSRKKASTRRGAGGALLPRSGNTSLPQHWIARYDVVVTLGGPPCPNRCESTSTTAKEAQGYWANSPDLDGLTVAADTREEVMQEAQWGGRDAVNLQGVREKPELVFTSAEYKE